MTAVPTRVALLVSPETFESFYGRELGLSRESYVHQYRNDFVWYYAEALGRHGVDVVVYVLTTGPAERVGARDGFEVRFLPVPRAWNVARVAIAKALTPVEQYAFQALGGALIQRSLPAAVAEDRVDLLFVQEYWTGRFDVLVRTAPVPVVAGEQGGSGGINVHVFKAAALRRAALIVVQSRAEQRRLRDRYGVAAERVPNGVDIAFFSPGSAKSNVRPRRVLVVARLLDAQKRISDVIRALAELDESWSLEIIGKGPDEGMLRALALQEGVAERVKFAGWMSDRAAVRDRLRSAGVYAMPSAYEGLSLAMLEAMACGAPVVATPLPAVRDAIQDGINGVLVPVGDVKALAGGLRRAHAEGDRLGRAARETIEREFDREATLARLAALVRAAAGGGQRA